MHPLLQSPSTIPPAELRLQAFFAFFLSLLRARVFALTTTLRAQRAMACHARLGYHLLAKTIIASSRTQLVYGERWKNFSNDLASTSIFIS